MEKLCWHLQSVFWRVSEDEINQAWSGSVASNEGSSSCPGTMTGKKGSMSL